MMPFTIALAGKGGTGKTTLAALSILLLKEREAGPILAVDADPNANLNELLGLKVARTVGELREETLERIADLPAGLPKEQYLELGLQECLVEDEGVDLLVMGHGEGPKCYCMVNHILRKYIEVLRGNYRYVVIDNEAGMEHLSRRTTQDVDALLIVAKADPISIRSARRISELAERLKLRVKERYLLLNDVAGSELTPPLEEELARLGAPHDLPLLGQIPHDEGLFRIALEGRPLLALSPDSPAKRAMAQILNAIGG
ncbi:MAG: ATP-binding protein [Candidatus Bipolaricaulia bacterium]